MRRRAIEPVIPIWIRSHEHHTGPAANKRLHQEAGHTTVPDQAATDSVLKPGLPTRGRPTYGACRSVIPFHVDHGLPAGKRGGLLCSLL